MLVLRWSAARAGAAGLAVTLVVAWFGFGFGTQVLPELGAGVANGGRAGRGALHCRHDRVLPLLGAQGFGAAVGNIVCPHNIVAAGATVHLTGREGEVLRRTLGVALLYARLGGVLALLLVQAGLAGDTVGPEPRRAPARRIHGVRISGGGTAGGSADPGTRGTEDRNMAGRS